MVVAKRVHMNASSATERITDRPLAERLRKTDMRRTAKRFTLFLKAVVMLRERRVTALLHSLEFKNLLRSQQRHPLQGRVRMLQRAIR